MTSSSALSLHRRTADLPPPVRAWVERSVAPDAPCPRRAELDTTGEIKLRVWHRYRARQLLAPPDELSWHGTARIAGVPVTVIDRYRPGAGETRVRLGSRLVLAARSDDDVTRSGAGRLAAEAMLLPTNAFAPWVRWLTAGDDCAVADIDIGGAVHAVELRLDGGRLVSLSLPRWYADRRHGRSRVFGVRFHGELTHEGITVPAAWTAGWDWTSDGWRGGPFFRAQLEAIRFDG